MKQALIIGSTVADVTVRLPHLPVTGQDVIVESQSMSLEDAPIMCRKSSASPVSHIPCFLRLGQGFTATM